MRHLLLILFFILTFSFNLIGQSSTNNIEGISPFKNFLEKDYKAKPLNFAIVEDKNGIIYLANPDGILTYDGENWTKTILEHNDELLVPTTLALDSSDRMMVGHRKGIGAIHKNQIGQLEFIPLTDSISKLLPFPIKAIADIKCTKKSSIFASREGMFSLGQNKVRAFKTKETFSLGIFQNRIYFYNAANKEKKGIYSLSEELTDEKFELPLEFESDDETVCGIYFHKNHIYIYSTRNNYCFNLYTKESKLPASYNKLNEELKNSYLYNVTKSRNIFIYSTFMKGTYITNIEGEILYHLNENNGQVTNQHICGILDANNNIWLGTTKSISRIQANGLSYWNNELDLKGILSDLMKINETIYLSSTEGFYIINHQSSEKLKTGQFFSIIKHKNEFLTSSLDGIFKIQDKDLIQLSNEENFDMILSTKNHILIPKENKLKFMTLNNNKLIDEGQIKIDGNFEHGFNQNDTTFWVLSDSFFTRFSLRNGHYHKQHLINLDTSKIIQHSILNHKGEVYILHGEKLYYYKNNKLIESPLLEDYLQNIKIQSFIDTDDKNIWFINKQNKLYRVYENELQNYQIDSFSYSNLGEENITIIKEIDDKFFFASFNGLFCHSEKKRILKSPTFKTNIRSIKNNDSLIQTKESEINHQSFEYSNRNFTFNFAATGSSKSKKYSIYLKGNDSKWSKWSNLTRKEYTNLREGHYTFYVKAKNELEIESNLSEYSFIILPPWYRTWWAYAGYAIASILFISLIVKWNTRRLKIEKEELEKIVQERTAEISQQKEEIQAQHDQLELVNAEVVSQAEEIQAQNDRLEEVNTDLDKKNRHITDSINYAKRIQNAMLTADDIISGMFKEHFILFIPRDIVSGDFYWAYNTPEGKKIWIAADCTGHGVPGAMMSMIGTSLLNEIVIEKKVTSPDEILNQLRENLLRSLGRGERKQAKEGMDISVCVLDNLILEFAGAYNPLYIVRDNELYETEADLMPVGEFQVMTPFTKQTIELKPGDSIYTFSDGYVDQMGGPKGRKFMFKKFRQMLIDHATLPMHEQQSKYLEIFEKWKGEHRQLDDVILFGVRV